MTQTPPPPKTQQKKGILLAILIRQAEGETPVPSILDYSTLHTCIRAHMEQFNTPIR